jgi:hypothetical protein
MVANTGSIGPSYDGDRRASYLLLDGAIPTIRRVDLPHADWIAKTLHTAAPPQMP